MRISAELQPEDHVKARRVHRRMSLGARLVFVVIPAVWGLHALWRLWDMRQTALVAYGAAAIAMIVLGVTIRRRVVRKHLLKQHAESVTSAIRIGADGIVITTGDDRRGLPWFRFIKYKKSRELVLLYLSHTDYLIFPYRWFTPEQRQELDDFLRRELGDLVG